MRIIFFFFLIRRILERVLGINIFEGSPQYGRNGDIYFQEIYLKKKVSKPWMKVLSAKKSTISGKLLSE